MYARFCESLTQEHLLPPGREVLLAVSGGRDSACLVDLCRRAGLPFAVAHCNFGLRGDDSDRDERFVERLATDCGARFHCERYDTRDYARRHSEGIEEAARHLRYAFFARLCMRWGYPCVLVAHHRDDSFETFFLNLLRGTGLQGLRGISRHSVLRVDVPAGGEDQPGHPATEVALTVVRPLLECSRADIDAYVQRHGVAFVEDATNAQLDARRNQIRHRLMPLLRDLAPDLDHTLSLTICNLREASALVDSHVGALAAAWRPSATSARYLPLSVLNTDLQVRRAELYGLLRPYGFGGGQTAAIATAAPGSRFLARRYRVVVGATELELDLLHPVAAPLPGLTVAGADAALDPRRLPVGAFAVDAACVALPFALRRWRAADRMSPLGMRGTKLVSDILKDLKLRPAVRDALCVVHDAEGQILALVDTVADGGSPRIVRTAQGARLTPATTAALLVQVG